MKVWIRSIALGAAGLLMSSGCRSVSTTHSQDICVPRFAPSDPAQVQILPNVPARPHIELGQVWAYSSDASEDVSNIEEALRKEAAKLGADALVVWSDGIQSDNEAFSPGQGGHLVKKVPGRTVRGAAIKYQ